MVPVWDHGHNLVYFQGPGSLIGALSQEPFAGYRAHSWLLGERPPGATQHQVMIAWGRHVVPALGP